MPGELHRPGEQHTSQGQHMSLGLLQLGVQHRTQGLEHRAGQQMVHRSLVLGCRLGLHTQVHSSLGHRHVEPQGQHTLLGQLHRWLGQHMWLQGRHRLE